MSRQFLLVQYWRSWWQRQSRDVHDADDEAKADADDETDADDKANNVADAVDVVDDEANDKVDDEANDVVWRGRLRDDVAEYEAKDVADDETRSTLRLFGCGKVFSFFFIFNDIGGKDDDDEDGEDGGINLLNI